MPFLRRFHFVFLNVLGTLDDRHDVLVGFGIETAECVIEELGVCAVDIAAAVVNVPHNTGQAAEFGAVVVNDVIGVVRLAQAAERSEHDVARSGPGLDAGVVGDVAPDRRVAPEVLDRPAGKLSRERIDCKDILEHQSVRCVEPGAGDRRIELVQVRCRQEPRDGECAAAEHRNPVLA